MPKSSLRYLAVVCLLSAATAFADPVTVPCGTTGCNASVPAYGGNAAYTINTYDDGQNLYLTFVSSTANSAQNFVNVYLNTDTASATTGDTNLGIEITNSRAFIPSATGGGAYYSLIGTGYSYIDSVTGSTTTIQATIPNTLLLFDPTGIPFQTTTPGDYVSLRYAQAFGYSLLGGPTVVTYPEGLGDAQINAAATPEPASWQYMCLAGGALSTFARKLRFKRRIA